MRTFCFVYLLISTISADKVLFWKCLQSTTFTKEEATSCGLSISGIVDPEI